MGRPRIDMVGRKFGHLIVRKAAGSGKHGHPRWSCRCRCGRPIVVYGYDLRRGKHTQCRPCAAYEQRNRLEGRSFGLWTVLRRDLSRRTSGKLEHYMCRCAGCNAVRSVNGYSLVNGGSTSCGCASDGVRAVTNQSRRKYPDSPIGVSRATVIRRVAAGWTVARALNTPPRVWPSREQDANPNDLRKA